MSHTTDPNTDPILVTAQTADVEPGGSACLPAAGELAGRLLPSEMFPAGDSRFRVRFVRLPSGLRLRTVECGEPDADRVAVCVHGWSCSVFSFRLLMPLLAAAGVRAVALDLPGHGLSDKPPEAAHYGLDALGTTVLQTMDALGIQLDAQLNAQRTILVGHSMGAPICARLAVTAPQRVGGLALLAPAGFGSEVSVALGTALTPRFMGPLLPYMVSRWMVGAVLRFASGERYRPGEREVDEYWAPSQYRGYARAMWDLLHCFDWKAGLDRGFGSIQVPTVVMDGSRDRMVVHRWVRRYADVIRHASFIEIPGGGHVVPEEAPDRVAEAVLSLL